MRLNVLLLCDRYPGGASTVLDHIDALEAHAGHAVRVLPMLGDLPPGLDLARFDAVVIHYSLFLALDEHLSPLTRHRLRAYDGLKAAFIQDEYRWVDRTVGALAFLGVRLLFTCVPQADVARVYPPERLPGLHTRTVLTGYVPEALVHRPAPAPEARPIDVGYRARRLSATFGALGQEKARIADAFAPLARRAGLRCDISCAETDRLYGEAWIAFVQSCRAMLGVESGASVFDRTGAIHAQVTAHEARAPDTPFEELRERYFPGLDGEVRMNQISPRCFEAAALRTLMVLYEGEYSGVLQPWRHYVPLRKDLANADEVIAAIRDRATWQRIVDAAYREVALDPTWSYATFARGAGEDLARAWTALGRPAVTRPYDDADWRRATAAHAAAREAGDRRRMQAQALWRRLLHPALAPWWRRAGSLRAPLRALRRGQRAAAGAVAAALRLRRCARRRPATAELAGLALRAADLGACRDLLRLEDLAAFAQAVRAAGAPRAVALAWDAGEGEASLGDAGGGDAFSREGLVQAAARGEVRSVRIRYVEPMAAPRADYTGEGVALAGLARYAVRAPAAVAGLLAAVAGE